MSIYQDRGIFLYSMIVAAIFGAAVGSFLNCAAYRIPRGESFLRGRSRCPSCGHTLGAPDLIPVLGWLFLKGRCRYCGEKISARYPLTECVFAALTVLCLLKFDLTPQGVRNYVFICCLFCLSLVDLESREVPDGCLLIAAVVWILALPFAGMSGREILLRLLAGATFGGAMLLLSLLMDHVLGKESLGGGDIKLFAVAGLYLGFVASLFTLLLACLLGLVLAFCFRLKEKSRRADASEYDGQIPFAPAIACAAYAMLLYGRPLTDWYISLLA